MKLNTSPIRGVAFQNKETFFPAALQFEILSLGLAGFGDT
jgi:hypothetical protein